MTLVLVSFLISVVILALIIMLIVLIANYKWVALLLGLVFLTFMVKYFLDDFFEL